MGPAAPDPSFLPLLKINGARKGRKASRIERRSGALPVPAARCRRKCPGDLSAARK